MEAAVLEETDVVKSVSSPNNVSHLLTDRSQFMICITEF